MASGRDHAVVQIGAGIEEDRRRVGEDRRLLLALVGDPREEIPDDMDPGVVLVVGPNDDPGGHGRMGARKHLVPRVAVVLPVFLGRHVDGADFPLLQRILLAAEEPFLLFVPVDIEIVLVETDPRADNHLLEGGDGLHELLILLV